MPSVWPHQPQGQKARPPLGCSAKLSVAPPFWHSFVGWHPAPQPLVRGQGLRASCEEVGFDGQATRYLGQRARRRAFDRGYRPNLNCSAGFQPARSRQDGAATFKLGYYQPRQVFDHCVHSLL
jgi:hypothetical protein